MRYNIYTFTALNRKIYVAELIQLTKSEGAYKEFLSPEELNVLAKRKHKQEEFIFSRYIIKKTAKISDQQAKSSTVKYCEVIKAAGIFKQQELTQKLSLSHSGRFVAFSFCSLKESVGVDIEVISNRDVKPLIDGFFCDEDKLQINQSTNQNRCFYQLWTEKEAVTKLVNTSIFTLLSCSSIELNKHYNIESIAQDDFIASIANDNKP